MAQSCGVKNNAPPFVQHDLTTSQATSVSYCELCGYGYVTIIITNPYQGADMTGIRVVENLGSSGLTYAPAAPTPVRYSINGGGAVNGPAPAVSGTNGSVLTWNAGSFPTLNAAGGANNFATLEITVPVMRAAGLPLEGLVTANRQIQATLTYSTNPVCAVTSPVSTGLETLPLREPIPRMTKLGRNVDANQGTGSYAATVYGNINDDVIWRIRVTNTGMAALQDMRFDDLMQTGGMQVNYACPTEAAASAIAAANGAGPGGSGCVAAGNTITAFDVKNPFGSPGNDNPDLVDVPANGQTDIFLVGKITSSCQANTTNTASNLQWGCALQAPVGGITATSTGATAGAPAATLSDLVVPSGLTVTRQLRGINTTQPVGSRGLMTITIRNNTGGTVKNIKLRDVLPLEYVMDPTFTPTLVNAAPFGNYPGITDRITWTNPAPGTFPLTSTNPADPLSNTQPQFTLWSSTTHPNYPDQLNMVRRGDVVTITFRVVLIKSSSYDRVANLDVTPENTADGTDPLNSTTLSNSLYLTYEDFCQPGVVKNAPTYPYADTFPAFPEDLDIAINGTVFILTNDPLQPLTLPVVVTNNGGHDARDYQVFVSFGATIQVQTAPAGCGVVALSGAPPQPAPWKAWTLPASIPATAMVYRCVPGGALPNPMAPGNSTTLNFTVIKTTDPARLALDDLSFRADVVGEITLSNGTLLWFPAPIARADGQTDRANNYSLDGVRARVIGFNLAKKGQGYCTENNSPLPALPDSLVQIGEECTFHIDTGGWFGFQTPGFTYIAVQNIKVVDQLPAGQGYVSSTNPASGSTSQVKQFSLIAETNPPLNPLDEGWIDWTFNPVLPLSNRITQKDEWFRVDATTRILNSALNASAAPNQQAATSSNVLNSTFEAVFNNASTGLEEIFLLGPGTIGYPLPPVRTVNLRVTEPQVTVVKTVCNETLYGAGPACSNFVPLANNGDTYDTYIYKVVVTNAAAAGGVTRAPAYDVSTKDILDPSDLMYVVPFASDGLDNDGDGLVDGADTNGEGTINDNVVNNGVPAQVTFSHTNSNALLKINPGASVILYYRVDPDKTVQAGQTLVNSVTASYDTLAGPSGAQTVVQSVSGTIGGARIYTSPASSATVQMLMPTVLPKKIVALSQPNHTVVVTPPAAQPVSVGEEIRYELHAILPIAELRNFVISDVLPVGVRCAEAPVVDLGPTGPHAAAGFSPGGVITPTCTDTQVAWNFGTQSLSNGAGISTYDFAVNFIGRVENTANTNNGNILSNGSAPSAVTASYTNSLGAVIAMPIGKVDVQVQEPTIALTQTIAPATADAGDVMTVTVTATNTGTGTAYNLRLLNDLSTLGKLSYVGSGVGGLDPPDVVDVATLGANKPIFIWNPANPKYAIAPGASRSFTFKISVNIGVQPLEVITNTLQAKWDSLPGRSTALNGSGQIGVDGSATGLRNGALPNAGVQPNVYETSTSATFSVPAVTMSKTDLTPAVVPAVGAYKNFQVDINLPEGTTQNVLVTDNLAFGGLSYLLANNAAYDITYSFQGIASINGAAPAEAAFTAFPADNTTGNAVWNIGTVVTTSENDLATNLISPRIRINYFARIDNTLSANVGSTLQNSVLTNYRNGATGATMALNATTAKITVVEPQLTLAKAVSNVTTPGLPPVGGDVLEYTLTLVNTGNSVAYDINIVDTLSPLIQYGATFTPTATIGATAVAGFVPTPSGAPVGPLVWGRANGDGSLDLPAGQTLIVKYQVIVQTATQPNTTISNSVYADWTSLNGASTFERTGAGCPSITAPNDHCVGPAVTSLTTPDNNSISKGVVSDSYVVTGLSTATDAKVRVGDTVTYQLNLNLQKGRTNNVVVQDALPAGMAFDGIVSINGVSAAPYAAPVGSNFSYNLVSIPSTGQTGTVSWNFGTVDNSAQGPSPTDTLVIQYKAKVLPNAGIAQVASTTLTNTATLKYVDGNGVPSPAVARLTSSATITVVQPIMATPTKTDLTPRPSGVTVNPTTDVMKFRLSACNTAGLAPAYGIVLTDALATQFNNASMTGPVVTINGAAATAGADYVYTPPPADAGSFTVSLNQGVNPGQCVQVDFNIGFDPIAPNQSWNNQLDMGPYWSLAPTSGQQYAPMGPVLFGMNNATVLSPPTKVLIFSSGTVTSEVVVGDELVYRITVPGTPVGGTLSDVKIIDTLNPALEFVGATMNGGATSVPNSGTPSGVVLNLGTVTGQAVLDLRVRVANNAAATAGVLIDNTVSYTYALASGGVPISGGTASTLASEQKKIAEPVVSLLKSVANVTNPGLAPKAGDVLRYTLTLKASGGVAGDNFSNAYDVSVLDNLSLGLAYQGNPTVTGTGNTIAAPTVVSGNGVTAPQILNWSLANGNANIDIVEGATVTVTYDVVVLSSVLANQALSNSAVAQWTSLNGSNAVERTGSGTPATNYYFTTPATTTLTTLDTTTLGKTRLTDTYGPADASVRIGDVANFELRMSLPAGTTAAAVVTDILPKGLKFESIVSINGVSSAPYASVAPFTYSSIAGASVTGDPLTGPSTVSWNIGNIVNGGVGNKDFVIVYSARLLNGVLAQGGGAVQTLVNNATLNYSTAIGATSKLASQALSLQQPMLAVTKASLPVAGSVIAPNDLVTYTVDIINSGTAPAYDVQLRDVIPLGMRNGVATITPVSTTLVGAGTVLPNVTPGYIAATGVVTFNFDSGLANQYMIPAGDRLRVVYRVQADAGLSAGMTMTNQAQVLDYCSFDNNAAPALGGVLGVRQCYGVTNTASTTLSTAAPNPLGKAITQSTAAIGEPFRYRITIPATPQPTALYDVAVVDNLGLSAADMSYVSVTPVSGPAWTPVVTGAPKNLVIAGSGAGIDIPAGQQLVFDVTVVLNDSVANVAGLTFQNTASYTFNQINGVVAPITGGAVVSASMTIGAPDSLTLQKSGPTTMRVGVAGSFTLNVQNTGTGTAWDMTLVDVLPDPTPGGMCNVAPTVTTAQVFQADGVTPVGPALVAGTDYAASFAPAPACTLTLTMKTAAAAIAPTNRLIVTYQAWLDSDNVSATVLTNRAAATQWFSADTPANVATGQIHTYSRTLADGTPGVLDFQDAYSITTEAPVLEFRKSVVNVTTGQNPGSGARPGDVLRYTVSIRNVSTLPLSNVTLTDELDRLNATAMFAPGSLSLVTVPAGAITSGTNASGGVKGTGLLDVRGLNISAMGAAGDTLQVVFEARLAPVISNGSVVLNQAQLPSVMVPALNSDDPNVNGVDNPAVIGDEDPTRTVITSSPLMQVKKTSQDLTGDPAVLMAGDRLRYTLTVKNIGSENAVNVSLRDLVPANTSYVAGSTRLNGVAVADVAGALPLQAGLLVNAPENVTPGVMRADASATVGNVATVTFDVQINASALNGALISNQGFVNGSGAGSGVFPEVPSDDPGTAIVADPTRNVVGNFPLLVAQKTVTLATDANGNGVLDPLDVVRYTITVNNFSALASTGVVLTDLVPANTTYVADTVWLNGAPVGQPDGGVSPLIAGISVNSPASASGTIAANSSAVVSFDARVNAGVAAGTVISNQGTVTSNELPAQLTDVDGNSSNGYQPTTIVVGSAQQVSITKEVMVVGGGAALPGSQLEYLVTVTNTGAIAASNVALTDDLGQAPLASQVTYVAGSAVLNGSAPGVSLTGAVLKADYAATYGNLLPGASAQLRFRVQIVTGLAMGSAIANTAQVAWNAPALTASASVSVAVGGIPGSASLNGRVWHDANFNKLADTGEALWPGWTVDVLRNNVLLGTVTTDANGQYSITGLSPSATAADQFSLRFNAPGSSATTAKLGRADSPFVNGLQSISGITALSGSNLQNLNLPAQPNGVTYDSIVRAPVAGAMLNMVRAGSAAPLPASCFDDPAQQGQITLFGGYYKFDLNFSDPSCPSGGDYLVQVTPSSAYMPGPSKVIAPLSDATTAPFSVPGCPGSIADAVPATNTYCEAQQSAGTPAIAVPAGSAGTNHYLRMTFNNSVMPSTSQIYNNHIAIDPRLNNAVSITKVAALQNVTRGQLVPYTITVSNTLSVTLSSLNIVDTFPGGFKYVAGSGRLDGQPVEPTAIGNQLTWGNLQLATNTRRVIQLMLVVGSGVSEGKYVNRAQVFTGLIGGAASPEATAAVRVVPDPTLDCSDVIGKVFDDANLNGYQDEGEMGLPGVRVVTARGLIVTADKFGRFHLTCAVVPDPDRGSNFILKVDDRSLPSGYRITTENPRVQRATRGKMMKFNFGAAIHRVVKLDLSDGVFEPDSVDIRVQWKQRVQLLLEELKKSASVLRLSYLAEAEKEGLIKDRLASVKREIEKTWKQQAGKYDLTMETEVFWRTGAPR